ncbi:hypothetical protein BpsS36_00011 [Bacillus phage vB_BpsS-36]|uniref:Uncharacterized protein n=1 Tax=Bacillus phage vB_BpsS-36 TaxID=2419622 RepID=A0A3G3BX13_9CAUD|nr:hypothetical protein BpsS36_00011 [Bacillus phage vB_BpsS-36]
MPDYTSALGLYKPNRADSLAFDTTLSDNFQAIDEKLGTALTDEEGTTHSNLRDRLRADLNRAFRGLPEVNVKDAPYNAKGDGTTNDTQAIQRALNDVRDLGGGTVLIPDGVFMTHATLEVFSRTKIKLSHKATVERAVSFSPMFLNGRKGVDNFFGYDGHGEILIEGGTIDGGASINSRASEIMFIHGKNIVFQDINFINNFDSHFIEVNACDGVKVLNCFFHKYSGNRLTEAIQIDLAKDSNVFPHMGAYDNTNCNDVLVQGCTFRDCSRGVGTHSAVAGYPATNIRIIGNHFEDLEAQAVRGFDWNNVTVLGNTMIRCGEGVEIRSVEQDCYNWTVADNIIIDPHRVGHAVMVTEDNGRTSHEITIVGNTCNGAGSNTFYFRNATRVIVANNTIDGSNGSSLWFTGNANRVKISGNLISNTQARGISFEGSTMSRVTIVDNTIDGATSFGIAVYGVNHGIIANNYVRNTSNFAIYLTAGADFFNVTGNKTFGSQEIHIRLSDGANDNLITGNHIHGGHASAVNITGTCSNNAVIGNFGRGKTFSGGTNSTYEMNVA